jgi:hypothetical protein
MLSGIKKTSAELHQPLGGELVVAARAGDASMDAIDRI